MRLRINTLLLCFLAIFDSYGGTWEEWIEKDAPFFSSVVNGRELGTRSSQSLLPRAIVFPLGQDFYAAYDVDLLRIASVWKAQGVPLKNPNMSVNSYPYEFKKVGSGQRGLPEINGELWFENKACPGFSLYPGSENKGIENLTYEVFSGQPVLPKSLKGNPSVTGKLPFGYFDLNYADKTLKRYSIAFNGQLNIPKAGTYTFTIKADRESRLFVGGKNLFESNKDKNKSISIKLNKGKQPIRLEYNRTWHLQYVDVTWSGPGFKDQPLSVRRPFVDPRPNQSSSREVGKGGLEEKYGQFLGVNLKENNAIEYKIGNVTIREKLSLSKKGLTRQLTLTPHKQAVIINLMDNRKFKDKTAADLFEISSAGTILNKNDNYICRIDPSNKVHSFSILYKKPLKGNFDKPKRGKSWTEEITLKLPKADDKDAMSLEKIPLPFKNSAKRAIRGAGIDFFSDGRLALVTFDGDVWIASGLKKGSKKVTWKRFASGLHEPLGLTIRKDELFVFDRNGLWRLLDKDKNGEADYHNLFCSQIDQTAGTREFAMAVEALKDGSFVICKPGLNSGSRTAGALVRISADGKTVTEIARGFRAPFMGSDPVSGQIAVTDQQGQYVPSTPIIFPQQGAYYGHPSQKTDNDLPVSTPMTWVPHQVCASSTSVVWARSSKLGQLEGKPILLSYNKPKILQIHTDIDDIVSQGGVTELPVKIDSPILNGAINPADGLLYLTGFKIYDSSASDATFLSRVRVNPKRTLAVPKDVRVEKRGIYMSFETALDKSLALNTASYSVKRWNYKRTAAYGSGNYKLDGTPGSDTLAVSSVKISKDRKSVFIAVPNMREVMQ
ncbi:MAG: PA14 domain-containing protein, partial [Lentisphaeraceae bacterium]|nr:PA14 domain-containing protein [Lentisphaeraceae bacterium]